MSHNHYFRDVSGLERIDVYRLLDLFGVTCPVAQHVVKKAIAAGQRGHKTLRRDWQDIADSAARKLEMIDEDSGWTPAAIKAAAFQQPEATAADWPNEQRRSEAEDVVIWPTEERIDAIGQNGGTGEHYRASEVGCSMCHGAGDVPLIGLDDHSLAVPCPACLFWLRA